MNEYLIPIILIVALCGCSQEDTRRYDFPLYFDRERMPIIKVDIEEVMDMDKCEIGNLPSSCAADLIYDLCQEIKRLRCGKEK